MNVTVIVNNNKQITPLLSLSLYKFIQPDLVRMQPTKYKTQKLHILSYLLSVYC